MKQEEAAKKDFTLATQCATRALHLDKSLDPVTVIMDLICCSEHRYLDLNRLQSFENFSFMHDIYGVQEHLNRKTENLEHGFSPRSFKIKEQE